MGMLYTPGQADALCTVIALGFIISSEGQLKDHSYIIYLDGTDDDAEYRRHRQLEAKLAKLTGMKKLFDPKPQTPGGKSRQPSISCPSKTTVKGASSCPETSLPFPSWFWFFCVFTHPLNKITDSINTVRPAFFIKILLPPYALFHILYPYLSKVSRCNI